MRMRHQLASIAQRLRLPIICALCNQYHGDALAICTACRQQLKPLGPACYHCAHPLPNSDYSICGYCCKKKPFIDQSIVAYQFEEPLRTLLHQFKYHEGLYLSAFLTTLIVDAVTPSSKETQCLLPIPLHDKRLRQRGFNQAAELAKSLSKNFNIPYDLTWCKKTKNTPPQASLNARQRQKNLHNAFQARALPYHHVTLIDDLMTTGNTVNELAKILKQQGVRQVDVWCCAKAVIL